MTTMNYILYGYAAIILIGGIIGYVSSKSNASIMAAIPAAILVAAASFLEHEHRRIALGIGLLVSVALTAIFIGRYNKTKKAMPAIPMIAISVVVALACIHAYMRTMHGAS